MKHGRKVLTPFVLLFVFAKKSYNYFLHVKFSAAQFHLIGLSNSADPEGQSQPGSSIIRVFSLLLHYKNIHAIYKILGKVFGQEYGYPPIWA